MQWFVPQTQPPPPNPHPPPPKKKKKKKIYIYSLEIFVKTVFFHQNMNKISFYKFFKVHYVYLIERYLCSMLHAISVSKLNE